MQHKRPIERPKKVKKILLKEKEKSIIDLLRKGWQKDIAMEIDRRFSN